jgi:hypothetical protein
MGSLPGTEAEGSTGRPEAPKPLCEMAPNAASIPADKIKLRLSIIDFHESDGPIRLKLNEGELLITEKGRNYRKEGSKK